MHDTDTYNPQPTARDDTPSVPRGDDSGRDTPRQDEASRRVSRPVDDTTADYLELLRVLSSPSADGDEDATSASRAVPLDTYLTSFSDGEDA